MFKWLKYIVAVIAAGAVFFLLSTTPLSITIKLVIALVVFISVLLLWDSLSSSNGSLQGIDINSNTGEYDEESSSACGTLSTLQEIRAYKRTIHKIHRKGTARVYRSWVIGQVVAGISINHANELLETAKAYPTWVCRKFGKGKKVRGKKRKRKYRSFIRDLENIGCSWRPVYLENECVGALGVRFVLDAVDCEGSGVSDQTTENTDQNSDPRGCFLSDIMQDGGRPTSIELLRARRDPACAYMFN